MTAKINAFLLAALVMSAPPLLPAAAPQTPYKLRWVYVPCNLLVDQQVEQVEVLIKRAAKSGFNALLLADYKLNILDQMPEHYFKNVEHVRKTAAANGVEIVPAIFPVGYSDGLLFHDPNLAEGLPVENAPFIVNGREAVLADNPAARIANGDLEEIKGNNFTGFYQDQPGIVSFADHENVHHGKVSCRLQGQAPGSPEGNYRLIQPVKVRPHACYRLSCWIKTRDFKSAGFRLFAMGAGKGNRALTFFENAPKPAQDWTFLEVAFNSLEETEVNVYAGIWGNFSGNLWLDEFSVEELSLVNVLRREGCPFRVTSEDGKTVFEEGKDFEPVRDAKLGMVPYAGQYEFNHPGAPLKITADSRIHDGDRLRVSWYHPIITLGIQVMCCLSEPKVGDILRDQVRRVNDLWKPRTFMMSHDEIRVAGWCRKCRESKKTPGALLADNARLCVNLIKEINPNAKIVVWSDMFDPHHNALDGFYLVNGTLKGSWEGLSSDVVIANWNSGHAVESLKWFADRGHAQILAGYYDAGIDNFKTWDVAAKGIPKVDGFMYTTWQGNYSDLEAYGRLLNGKK